MNALCDEFQAAVDTDKIPGAVLLAKDVAGRVSFERSFGYRTVQGEKSSRPWMDAKTVMRFASASKFITSIMAMQCVERGILDLEDESISQHLPEISNVKLITGFDDAGQPVLREPKTPVTLRQLLSHSSGLTYALTIPLLRRYQEWRDCPSEGNGGDTMEENFLYPLTYDPGTGWGYGPNLDWTGRLIERATQMNLDEYMQKHICEPLGIVDMTFKLQRRPDMIERLSDMTKRDDETGRLCFEDLKYFHEDPRDCFGGQGVWTTPEEYFKILCSILFNDGKLLQRETRDLLFEPSLTRESESALHDQCFKYRDWHLAGPVPPQVQKTYGLGGLITEEDCDKKLWRRKGNLSWSGLPCIVWNIDSETGLCSLFVFHMKPWGDSTCFKLGRRFEEVMVALTKK